MRITPEWTIFLCDSNMDSSRHFDIVSAKKPEFTIVKKTLHTNNIALQSLRAHQVQWQLLAPQKVLFQIESACIVLDYSSGFNRQPDVHELKYSELIEYMREWEEDEAMQAAASSSRDQTSAPECHLKCNCTKVAALTSIQKSGMTRYLNSRQRDFNIISEDGQPHPVHAFLIREVWPFFDTMMDVGMSEAKQKKLTLPYPSTWVQSLVSYFYGEQFDVSFDVATGLLLLGKTYDIEELELIGLKRIYAEELDVEKAVLGWHRAHRAGSDVAQTFFSEFLCFHLPEVADTVASADFSEVELLQLFLESSKCYKDVKK